MYNILIGGAAGQGIDTTVAILEKLLKHSGYYIYTTRDFMSRVRGGHNFSLLRFGSEKITSHSDKIDGIIALNDETIHLHKHQLTEKGFILCDSSLAYSEPGVIKLDMEKKAKELGNIRVSGSIAIGAVLRLFGEPFTYVEEVMAKVIRKELLEINLKAIQLGYESVEPVFEHLDGPFKDYMLISGSKALGLGAIAGGLKFYAAYPMSPSTAVMEYLARVSTEAGVVVEQAEDEIAAINMALGASYAGARAMTGTSGGGFCLKVEALGFSGIAEIPLVAVDVQRPGPATGLPTRTEQSDLKFVISAAQGEFPRMVIALRNHEDAFYQTARALNLAEKYQIPVILLSDQYLGDTTACVKPYDTTGITLVKPAEEAEGEYLRYRLTEDGISPRLIPGKTEHLVTADSDEHDERGFITESAEVRNAMMDKRMKKLNKLIEELQEPEFIGEENCKVLLLGWGSTYGPVAEAVSTLNKQGKGSFGALVFGDIYPLPKKSLEKYGQGRVLINVEQNATGQLASLIREQTGITCSRSILKYDGRQISGEEIVKQVLEGGF
ncbi:2-oxoglutarate ferredoxin oxidoreductase subunit alpha [Anaerocolumna jejuensis DSM 15929]|uniref:2-oxoglutarate ferredoxin oxidoreductase subunit alpha n=1 Tax=Anaerocolumna jejuensis DSM 15929 TaxID=1121322 RepID=A0A1M6MUP8_9FIRM|nr:2-oxoacid:acceptor oxidoreductase subunit alpha [Anaerocolumna jejuensis]SHJ87177.1 2-oxoglutarate ferredoxin oxidoreductase subunit alpha [Anaerocolumna jejuensis DSM 15929]